MALKHKLSQSASTKQAAAMAAPVVARASFSRAPAVAPQAAAFAGVAPLSRRSATRAVRSSRAALKVQAIRDGQAIEGRKLRVAVIGGGPSGACAAETLAKGGCEAFLIERKMDNCKVRSGAVSDFASPWNATRARIAAPRRRLDACALLHVALQIYL